MFLQVELGGLNAINGKNTDSESRKSCSFYSGWQDSWFYLTCFKYTFDIMPFVVLFPFDVRGAPEGQRTLCQTRRADD